MAKLKFNAADIKLLKARAKILPDCWKLTVDGKLATTKVQVRGFKIKHKPEYYGVSKQQAAQIISDRYYTVGNYIKVDKFQFLKSWVMKYGMEDPEVLNNAEKKYIEDFHKVKKLIDEQTLAISS